MPRSTTTALQATVVRAPAATRIRLRDVRGYGPVLRVLATRDLKVKYKQTYLGPFWLVIQPLALLAAFVVGFRDVAHVSSNGVPYVLFVLAGLSVWSYFQATTTMAVGSLINNFPLVRWTPCPRLALPLSALLVNLPSFAVPLVALLIGAGVDGRLGVRTLLVLVLALWLIVFVGGCGLIVAALTVRARDVSSALPFLLQLLLFLSPVGYPAGALPHGVRTLFSLNPLSGLMQALRWSALGVPIDGGTVAISGALTVLLAGVAWWLFTRLEPFVADDI